MYKINNIEFKTKKELKSYTHNLLMNNLGKTLTNEDDTFARELIKYHEHNYKLDDVISISCKDISERENITVPVFVMNQKNNLERTVSLHRCINNIPISNVVDDFIFKFGKYKGKSIKDIDDKQYIDWLLNQDFLWGMERKIIWEYISKGSFPVMIKD